MTSRVKTLCSVALCLLCTIPVVARQFFVAKDGNDAAAGSQEQPWLTVTKAANTLIAGDTVYIRAGVYRERLTPRNSGSPGRPILYSAYPGETVTLDGQGLGGPGIVNTDGRDYLSFFGVKVINGSGAGFWVINSSYVTIRGCHTYNTYSSGIIVSEFGVNDHVYIDSNKVELACNDGAQECISISKCTVFEVTRNEVFNGGPGTRGGEGIDCKFGSHNGIVAYNYVHHLSRQGLYADAWSEATSNIVFFGNIVHNCQFGIGAASEQGGALSNISFHNNLVYDCEGPGMYILMSAGPMSDIHFINNTIHNVGYRWGRGMWFNGSRATGVIVRNNIFSGLSGQPFQIQAAPAEWTVDHNLAEQAQPGLASGFIVATPQYVSIASADFRLTSGSPGIDAGSSDTKYDTSLGDLDRNGRLVDGDCDGTARIDIGAYEFQTSCSRIAQRQTRPGILPAKNVWSRTGTFNVQGRVVATAPATCGSNGKKKPAGIR